MNVEDAIRKRRTLGACWGSGIGKGMALQAVCRYKCPYRKVFGFKFFSSFLLNPFKKTSGNFRADNMNEMNVSLLDSLGDMNVWVDFYEQKVGPDFFRLSDAKELFHYIRSGGYEPVVARILAGEGLSIPVKKRIAKADSTKKRVVYSMPEDETVVLKLLTWLMIRKYDSCLSRNLYSFRPHYGAKDTLRKLLKNTDIADSYSYKLDVSNYFNSIDVDLLLPMLKELFHDDEPLYRFISTQLRDPRAFQEGKVVEEKKGVMAGIPYAVFLANVFLSPLDREFEDMPEVVYCRYSDDIIIFSKDKEILEKARQRLHAYLDRVHLGINPAKVVETLPGESWTFLGFTCDGKDIDVSEVSVQKLKARMRRKARALQRWSRGEGKDGRMAVRAFIKYFNRKLYTSESASEVNWSWWYFPLITTDRSLKMIDAYMQDCIRFVATGSRTKSRFNFRYEQMKDLGLFTLVNMWYKYKNGEMMKIS